MFVEDGSDNVVFQVDNSGNTTVEGTLQVTNSITSNGTELSIVDTLVKIGANADADDNNRDIGIYAPLSGNNENLGLIWDENEGYFKLYESLNAPSGERFNFSTGSASKLELGELIVGIDADGADRILTFGHATVKTVIGIDDDQDVFAINTSSAFTAQNDLEIDGSGNVTLGLGNLSLSGSGKGISLTKDTTSGDEASLTDGKVATSNTRAFQLALTTNTAISDDAAHLGFTVGNTEVSTSSVIMATVATAVDSVGNNILSESGIEVYAYALTNGSFKFALTNRTGSEIAVDAVITINFVVL